ncbi:Rsc9p [Sugiyamaella lignohabitans]|uniref:Rsc9p n=1 Tax=Sugiyamaella lignohabitans TaxID=796027 RepID=A0A167E6I3_9ASCO|nr:Rsc9p [Sugiyamaella lignohabitans]ANB13706.1 Rsc9p [Sugiyamaella lignohabitans]
MSSPGGRVLRHHQTRPNYGSSSTPNTRISGISGPSKTPGGISTPGTNNIPVHVRGGTVMSGLTVSNGLTPSTPGTPGTPSPSTPGLLGSAHSVTPQPTGDVPAHMIPPASMAVYTPQNAPHLYQSTVYQRINPSQQPYIGMGMRGVDFIVRISMSLQCGIEDEVSWALKALLELSVRQPGLIQFKNNTSIPLLLFDKIARSSIFAAPVSSTILNDSTSAPGPGLDSEVDSFTPSNTADDLQVGISSDIGGNTTVTTGNGPESSTDSAPITVPDLNSPFYGSADSDFFQLHKTIEALLILRNASLDPENAHFLANSPFCNEIVLRGLQFMIAGNDPKRPNSTTSSNPAVAEISSYCIDIAESISFHMTPDSPSNPLFATICKIISASTDRSTLIPTIRCLSRLMIRDDKNIVGSVPLPIVSSILRYLLVTDDEELMSASLDFLYQYTARRENVSRLINISDVENGVNNKDAHLNLEIVTTHLSRLLTYKIEPQPVADYIRLPRKTKEPVPTEPPKLPAWILKELYAMEEPDRATHWIRTCYIDDEDGEVTQISLWKAYEAQFETFARESGRRLLPAVDFIKNVTSAFRTSSAMVVQLPGGQKKFIIKGIRPREYPIAPSVLNAPKQPDPKPTDQANSIVREPSAVCVTSALVLQNIARSPAGRTLLRPRVEEFIGSYTVNLALGSYIDGLLDIVSRSGEHDLDDEDHK